MFKYISLVLLSAIFSITSVKAETYWLNIPASFSKVDEQYIPPMSFPVRSHDACSDAIVEYAKTNLVYYIGCDVKPLPDAVNLKKQR
jgi:hypothetical protein